MRSSCAQAFYTLTLTTRCHRASSYHDCYASVSGCLGNLPVSCSRLPSLSLSLFLSLCLCLALSRACLSALSLLLTLSVLDCASWPTVPFCRSMHAPYIGSYGSS